MTKWLSTLFFLCAVTLGCAQLPRLSEESRVYSAGFAAIGLDESSTGRVLVASLPASGAATIDPIELRQTLLSGVTDASFTTEIADQLIANLASSVELRRGGRTEWGRGRNPVRVLSACLQLLCFSVVGPARIQVSPVATYEGFAMFECRLPLHLRKHSDRLEFRFVVLQKNPQGGGYLLLSPKRFAPVISVCGAPGGAARLLLGLRQVIAEGDVGYF